VNVLLTGATGFVGGNLLRMLHERGYHVRYLSRGGKEAIAARGLQNVECVAGDLADHPSLERAAQGMELVFHAGAMTSMEERDRKMMERVNVEGTAVLLAAAKRAGVRRFVHVSTVDTMGLPGDGSPGDEAVPYNLAWLKNPYPDTKVAAEKLVIAAAAAGQDCVIVNPGYMIGEYDAKGSSSTMVLEIMRKKGVLAPDGGNSFVDVLDVCRGCLLAAERGKTGERYILAGHNLTYFDFWTRTAKVVGVRGPIAKAPGFLAMFVAACVELLARLRKKPPLFSRRQVRMSLLPHYFSSHKAERELGYAYSPIEPAIARAAEWFRANTSAR
jgi:dihydroflavonol-4-reductase